MSTNNDRNNKRVLFVSGSSKGIGKYLVEYYLAKGYLVTGCSRGNSSFQHENYRHFSVDVSDEINVKEMFAKIHHYYGGLDVLVNNAGIASMNHLLLTPVETARRILETNFIGTFLLCREAAKLMRKRKFGRIVNLVSVAVPLKLEGEAVYAASKAAIISLTQIAAKELASFDITVNAVGPTPIPTDLIKAVPEKKIEKLISLQAIPRPGKPEDVSNVIDFFIQPESQFITGQVIFLGGV
jgi:3-oxoacyl-[acyl-carrier protein] reductase